MPSHSILDRNHLRGADMVVVESSGKVLPDLWLPLAGHRPCDPATPEAMARALAVTEGPGTPFGAMVREIWSDLQPLLEPPSPSTETRS